MSRSNRDYQARHLWRWPSCFKLASAIGSLHFAIAWTIALLPALALYVLAPRSVLARQGLFGVLETTGLFLISFALGQLILAGTCIIVIRALPCRIPEGNYSPSSWRVPFFALYYALYHSCVIVVFPAIRNTWLYVLFLRALGAKIGEGTYVNTNWISDAHLIEIASGTMIGWDAILDPHSSENGRTIFQRIKIGNNVSIGMRTIILPGAVLEDDVIVGANSVVLKGQVLLAGGLYIGSPARPI